MYEESKTVSFALLLDIKADRREVVLPTRLYMACRPIKGRPLARPFEE